MVIVNVDLRYARLARDIFDDRFRRYGHPGPSSDQFSLNSQEIAEDFIEVLKEHGVPADEIYPPRITASAARVAKKWQKLPKGWTEESVKKFWGTVTDQDPKHPVKKCIDKMTGKVSDPGAFCGALADRVKGTDWRHEPRTAEDKEACGCGQNLMMMPDYGTSDAALPRSAMVHGSPEYWESEGFGDGRKGR